MDGRADITMRFTTKADAIIALKADDYLGVIEEFQDWLSSTAGITATYQDIASKFKEILDLYSVEILG